MSFLPLETPMYPVITSLNSLYLVEQKSDFFFPPSVQFLSYLCAFSFKYLSMLAPVILLQQNKDKEENARRTPETTLDFLITR